MELSVGAATHLEEREREPCDGAWRRQHQITAFFSAHPEASSIRWWRVGDEKIITLWLLTFPCLISCWYNSITLSNKPFQKQLEPDFNWAANQLLLALIWLSHCWIAFDDCVRRSRWDNHLRYPALIPVLNITGDVAVQVRKLSLPIRRGTQASNRRMRNTRTGLVCPPSGTSSKLLLYTCPLFVIHICRRWWCPIGWRRRIRSHFSGFCQLAVTLAARGAEDRDKMSQHNW